MSKATTVAGVLLALAGLTGVIYALGINVPRMIATRATDYSFITAYTTEWFLVLIGGLVIVLDGLRRK